ncbi:hypothetical protein [Chondromyces apiculatus]|uniref:Uncharacterized protein n=1 Tax=Chondromyces apiculatus DSM 436 TaxID=1192034 RepID=A0A017TG62_9BACT|nr:hypothetical protein [Chondromyces apiculatus]EYF07912.1 Hypothetical protein CAP_6934 [Chondromyces apiculatus DSM 436]
MNVKTGTNAGPLLWATALAFGLLVGCGGDDTKPSATGGPDNTGGAGGAGGTDGAGGTGGSGLPPEPPVDPTPWSGAYGDLAENDFSRRLKLDVDPTGNVALIGMATGILDFGGGPFGSATASSGFLARFDVRGNHVWSRRLSTALPFGVAFDREGNMVVTGKLTGEEDFGGGPLVPADGTDLFIVKLDPEGGHLWSKAFGAGGSQQGTSVAVKDTGDIVITGTVAGTIDLGGGPLESGTGGTLIAQLDADGNHAWSRVLADTPYPDGIAVDRTGGIVVAIGGAFPYRIVKLDPGGADVWSRDIAGAFGDTLSNRVSCDDDGNVLVTGHFGSTLQIGSLTLEALSSAPLEPGTTDYDGFVAKLDASGTPLWARRFGDGAAARGIGVAAVGDEIALAGIFDVSMDLGGAAIVGRDCSTGFASRLDAAGNALWSRPFANEGVSSCLNVQDMAMSGTSNLVMTGFFAGTADFGTGPTSRGDAWPGWTAFVAKLPQ